MAVIVIAGWRSGRQPLERRRFEHHRLGRLEWWCLAKQRYESKQWRRRSVPGVVVSVIQGSGHEAQEFPEAVGRIPECTLCIVEGIATPPCRERIDQLF